MFEFLFGSREPMTVEEYWAIRELHETGDLATADKLLRKRKRAFRQHVDALWDRAHNWDLWGAAYVIFDGCSDDGFQDFKGGVLSLDSRYARAALAEADSLADLPDDILRTLRAREWGSIGTADPSGEPWDEDAEVLKSRFPRLWARFGETPLDEDYED